MNRNLIQDRGRGRIGLAWSEAGANPLDLRWQVIGVNLSGFMDGGLRSGVTGTLCEAGANPLDLRWQVIGNGDCCAFFSCSLFRYGEVLR